MGFIDDIALTEATVSGTFYSKKFSVVNGVPQPESFTEVATHSGLFWQSGAVIQALADTLRTSVDAVFCMNYDATIAALDAESRLSIDSKNYRILNVENIGNQNEALQIPVKKEDGV